MASRGVNKVILIGNMGQPPDVRDVSSGVITSISIATSETWKDKQTGENKETTEWHRVVFFGKLAEIARDYLKKGSKVYIEGSLRTRKWEKDGVTHYTTEIIASAMQMLDSKDSSDSPKYTPKESNPTPSYNSPSPKPSSSPPAYDPSDLDDDIPF